MLALIPLKTFSGLKPLHPRSSKSVIFPHQGLGDLIWTLGVAKYHLSKYQEVVLIANKTWCKELSGLLCQHAWGKGVRLFPIEVDFKIGDTQVTRAMQRLFPGSDFYPLGWFADSYSLFYPDGFYLDGRTPRSFMESLRVPETTDQFEQICKKYQLSLTQFGYLYVHLQSGTQNLDPSSIEEQFFKKANAPILCPHHLFKSASEEHARAARHFREVAGALSLWENLILSVNASETIIIDSALFNLMAATKLWPRHLTVFRRTNYHHFWGPALKGSLKQVSCRGLKNEI